MKGKLDVALALMTALGLAALICWGFAQTPVIGP